MLLTECCIGAWWVSSLDRKAAAALPVCSGPTGASHIESIFLLVHSPDLCHINVTI